MIIKHKHMPQELTQGKDQITLTKENPFIVLVQNSQSAFLNHTVLKIMRHYNIRHQIKIVDEHKLSTNRQLMNHKLPMLMFSRFALGRYELIELLCDISLSNCELLEFQARKALVKKIMENWSLIFDFERYGEANWKVLAKMGIMNERDYKNTIYQQLYNLQTYFHKEVLQRQFHTYNQDTNIENIVFVQLIQYILKNLPETYPDFFLRVNFSHLVELKERLKKNMEREERREEMQTKVLVEKVKSNQEGEYKLHINRMKYFIPALAIVGGIYFFNAKK